MGIWVGQNNKIIVQGITGKSAGVHVRDMLDYGTTVVAGVSPGKKGSKIYGIPVYNTVAEAREATDCDTSLIFVPAPFAPDAIIEAVEAGIQLIVCITEHIPVADMIFVKRLCEEQGVRLIGPNCPGILTTGGQTHGTKLGIMPASIFAPGKIGVVSRSGTLTYEAVDAICKGGLGISTAVGIGGDPVIGTNFTEALYAFEHDPHTVAVVMLGEIGGTAEQEAADFIAEHMTKPVVAFISGKTAPKGKRMGHAGAIVSGRGADAAQKEAYLHSKGIKVTSRLAEIPAALAEVTQTR